MSGVLANTLLLRNFYPNIRQVNKTPIVSFSESETVHLRDPVELKHKLSLMKHRQQQSNKLGSWSSTVDVISDFDQTISAFRDDNEEDVSATFGIFRKSHNVPVGLNDEANELFEKYHLFEVSKELPFHEKKMKMDDWLNASMGLILKNGIDCAQLQRIMNDNTFAFRHNFDSFLRLCAYKQLNLIVLSGGIQDVIFYIMDSLYPMRDYRNFHLLANKIYFDETGKVIGSDKQVVHSHNKDSMLSRDSVQGLKSSCILLGDMPHDSFMTKYADYENEIKIGFARSLLEVQAYQKKYDIVLHGQGSFVSVEYLLRMIIADNEPIPESLNIKVNSIAKNLRETIGG